MAFQAIIDERPDFWAGASLKPDRMFVIRIDSTENYEKEAKAKKEHLYAQKDR